MNWIKHLQYDPLPSLLDTRNEALVYFVKRDLLGEDPGPVDALWPTHYEKTGYRENRQWVALAIGRMLKRFWDGKR
ncbi:MAG: hypothetical protein V1789_00935 [PVC group bacterium]